MHSDLKSLYEMTESLPPLPVIHKNGTIEIDMQAGESVSTGLMNVPNVAVCDTGIAKDSMSPIHAHKEREWFILYEGDLIVVIYDSTTETHHKVVKTEYALDPGDYFFVEADVRHAVGSQNGAKLIAISVPRSEVFPSVRSG